MLNKSGITKTKGASPLELFTIVFNLAFIGKNFFESIVRNKKIAVGKAAYEFEPVSRTITVNNRDVFGADFTMIIIDSDGNGLIDDIEEGWCTGWRWF